MYSEFQNRLRSCGIGSSDEVMLQTLAPKEAADAVVALRAVPVFVDSEPQTGNMYAEQLRNGIRSRFAETGKMPKAIVPMSVGGKEYNKEYIVKVANRYDITIVEYPAPDKDELPMPLHLQSDYSQYMAFVNGVAENLYNKEEGIKQ